MTSGNWFSTYLVDRWICEESRDGDEEGSFNESLRSSLGRLLRRDRQRLFFFPRRFAHLKSVKSATLGVYLGGRQVRVLEAGDFKDNLKMLISSSK